MIFFVIGVYIYDTIAIYIFITKARYKDLLRNCCSFPIMTSVYTYVILICTLKNVQYALSNHHMHEQFMILFIPYIKYFGLSMIGYKISSEENIENYCNSYS